MLGITLGVKSKSFVVTLVHLQSNLGALMLVPGNDGLELCFPTHTASKVDPRQFFLELGK